MLPMSNTSPPLSISLSLSLLPRPSLSVGGVCAKHRRAGARLQISTDEQERNDSSAVFQHGESQQQKRWDNVTAEETPSWSDGSMVVHNHVLIHIVVFIWVIKLG